jgi:hypothetical protein
LNWCALALVKLQSRLLPDRTPDVHYRTARGGQKLRDIMLDGYIDLYGPYVSHCTRAAPWPHVFLFLHQLSCGFWN